MQFYMYYDGDYLSDHPVAPYSRHILDIRVLYVSVVL